MLLVLQDIAAKDNITIIRLLIPIVVYTNSTVHARRMCQNCRVMLN